MVQPFVVFEKRFLAKILNMRYYYLVAQTYHAAYEANEPRAINILLTDYANPGLARIHFNAIRHEPQALLLNLSEETGLRGLLDALSLPGRSNEGAVSRDESMPAGGQVLLQLNGYENSMIQFADGYRYNFFWGIVPDSKKLRTKLLLTHEAQIREYIKQKTGWKVAGKDLVDLKGFQVKFGELWATLTWRTEQRNLKFSEIENIAHVL